MTIRDHNAPETVGGLGEKIVAPAPKPPDKPRWTPPPGRIVTGPDGKLRTNIPENEKVAWRPAVLQCNEEILPDRFLQGVRP